MEGMGVYSPDANGCPEPGSHAVFFFAMMIFDLFGDPVSANHGGRGRPAHVPTQQNRNLVSMLAARRWPNERIAGVFRITLPTFRKHYFSEMKLRDAARDRLDARKTLEIPRDPTNASRTHLPPPSEAHPIRNCCKPSCVPRLALRSAKWTVLDN
jgi:hypothetical protein